MTRARIPVVLDTDIGGDIDDTWALAFLLRCPEMDLKLVVTNTGDTEYRARIAAKILEVAGRDDIPVAAGTNQGPNPDWDRQRPWVENYDLSRYRGGFRRDGARAMVQALASCSETPTLISIGPATNVGEALSDNPGFERKCRMVGMFGSLEYDVEGKPGPIPENNVVVDVTSAQAMFQAPWLARTITPLDTCGRVRVGGERYQRLAKSPDPLVGAVMENYRIWASGSQWNESATRSSILFDTAAIYLAWCEELLEMREMGIRVTDKGLTVPDESAMKWRCAVAWKDLDRFSSLLTERLLGNG